MPSRTNCGYLKAAVFVCLLIVGCRHDATPVASNLPSGVGMWNSSPVGGDDWKGKGELVPGIEFCSYAASSGLDDFVFFVWGDFNGGSQRTTTKNTDGLQFHDYLIDQPKNRHVEFAGDTKDGRTGKVTVDGKPYDLASGTLFLVSARREYRVLQLERDLARFQSDDGLLRELGKSDTEIVEFFRSDSTSE